MWGSHCLTLRRVSLVSLDTEQGSSKGLKLMFNEFYHFTDTMSVQDLADLYDFFLPQPPHLASNCQQSSRVIDLNNNINIFLAN